MTPLRTAKPRKRDVGPWFDYYRADNEWTARWHRLKRPPLTLSIRVDGLAKISAAFGRIDAAARDAQARAAR